MKKTLEAIKIDDLSVNVEIAEQEHPSLHSILFTATCGESVKQSTMTLSVPAGTTDETVMGWINEHARFVAEEAATHERGRVAKKKLFGV